MVRSLFSGVSGLKTHQQKMDVIGNNIANVNTYGFKASRVTFQDVYYQTMRSATGANAANNIGGNNPSEIGYGTQVASIDTIMSRSGFASTGVGLDMAIAGEGFFIVQNASGDISYTRAGIFDINEEGFLVDSDGNYVMGFNSTDINVTYDTANDAIADTSGLQRIQIDLSTHADPLISGDSFQNLSSFSVGSDGMLTGRHSASEDELEFGRVFLGIFPNPNGLTQEGGTRYAESVASGQVDLVVPSLDGSGGIVTGALEMSNVDLSQEFTDMIITQRGFQANSRIITTSDSMLEELVNLKR